MILFLFSLPWFVSAILIILIFSLLSLLGLFIVRKIAPVKLFSSHHDFTAFSFNTIGLIYAVLLGFTIWNSQEKYTRVRQTTMSEAQMLVDLYRGMEVFPENDKKAVRTTLRAYAQHVINEEWPLMASGQILFHHSYFSDEIWHRIMQFSPRDRREQVWLNQELNNLNTLSLQRRLRLFESLETLGWMFWVLLIGGGIINVIAIYFFYVKNVKIQAIMTVLLSGTITFMLYIILCLDHPFLGDAGMKPYPFEWTLKSFDEWDQLSEAKFQGHFVE